MKTILLVTLVAVFCSPAYSQPHDYPGTDIRGLIQTYSANGQDKLPLANASVVLYANETPGGKWVTVARTSSDEFGYYYFHKIKPGQYYIQVNGKKNYKITVVQIDDEAFRVQEMPAVQY